MSPSALLANDSDIDGDTLAVSDVSNAAGGSVDLTAGVVTFTPDADLCGDGEGSFDYDISDGNGGSDSAHATVDITCDERRHRPLVDDSVDVTEDTATDVTSALLANDSDIDGDTLSVIGRFEPHGRQRRPHGRRRHLHARPPTCAATARAASTTTSVTATVAATAPA